MATNERFDFPPPGKVAWTRVHRFRQSRLSAGLLLVPLASVDAIDDVADFLVHERGWRVVHQTDESVHLQRCWGRQDELNPALLLALMFVGILPALIYFLGTASTKPVKGELSFTVLEADGDETVLECLARPYGRVQKSTRALAKYLWFDAG